MSEIRVLTATFAIVTPLFLSGARQDRAEIRAASLRGALRFWWRALAWAEVDGTAPGSDGARLARLGRVRQLETLLFGHAGSRRDSRQAALSIVVEPRETELKGVRRDEVLLPGGPKGKTTVGPGARYLGYGLIGAFGATEGKLSRPCIAAEQGFQVRFRLTVPGDLEKSGYTQADYDKAIALFERALRLFGLVGGLGSRARRGWGSIALHALEGSGSETFTRPATVEDYIAAVKKQLPKHAHDPLPPYTALGRDSRVEVVVPDDGNALSVLDTMGKAMQRYRSWGHTKKHSDSGPLVNDQPSEKNFQDDHDWFRKNSEPRFSTQQFVPRRSIFGLPHNYGDGFGVTPSQPGLDRRASPLFLHVHPLARDWFIGVALLLPARFLPENPRGETLVTVKARGRNEDRPFTVPWKELTTLLDGPAQPDARGRAPYFPHRRPVVP